MAVYWTDSGHNINTIETGGKPGGEGIVYRIAKMDPYVAKIYHAKKLNDYPELHDKLRIMLANPPRDNMRSRGFVSIAWPRWILYADRARHRFVGYVMPRVEPRTIFEYYNPSVRADKHPGTTWRDLHRIGSNLCAALAAIHAMGYVVGDLNESNLFVNDKSLVTIVDTDSFQVPDPNTGRLFLCGVFKPQFLPYELRGKKLANTTREITSDLFALSVLVFMLLMEGNHPFSGGNRHVAVSGDSPAFLTNISDGHFPYGGRGPNNPPPSAPPFDILPGQLRSLFIQAFQEGHTNPARRPTARDWYLALKSSEKALVECRVNRTHFYHANRPGGCPWCQRERGTTRVTKVNYQSPPAAAAVPINILTQQPAAHATQPPINVLATAQPTLAPAPAPQPATTNGAWRYLVLLIVLLLGAFFVLRNSSDGGPIPPSQPPAEVMSGGAVEPIRTATPRPRVTATSRVSSTQSSSVAAPSIPSPTRTRAPQPTSPPPQPLTRETVFCPDAFPTRLSIGDTARIINYQLNVRSGPGTRYSIERRLDPGRAVEILEGPVCDDGQLWYYIISEVIRPRDGSQPYRAEGWLVEESGNQWFLEPVK